MAIGRFQCGIAAIIYHPATQTYLLLKRSDQRDYGSGDWESVTGRVDQGESFEEAVYREVREELGVTVKLDFLVGTTHFYRGEAVPENELLGVKYVCSIDDRDSIRVSEEHSEARWLSADEIFQRLKPDHWLYPMIERAEKIRKFIPPELWF